MNDMSIHLITLNPHLVGIVKQAPDKAVGVFLPSAIFNL